MPITPLRYSNMATLTALPIELLHLIFSHAEKQSRGQLRLTSRLLAGVGEPWVFQQVRVSPTLKSYERLERILENDHLSRHIAKVYLDIRKWHPARTVSDSTPTSIPVDRQI